MTTNKNVATALIEAIQSKYDEIDKEKNKILCNYLDASRIIRDEFKAESKKAWAEFEKEEAEFKVKYYDNIKAKYDKKSDLIRAKFRIESAKAESEYEESVADLDAKYKKCN